MFKASSLLLLALVLNIQLCSSAPIPAKVDQSPVVAKEPVAEELAPVPEDHSHFIEEKESVQKTLIPVVAGEAAPSPEDSPAEEANPGIAKEPEPVFIGDQVSDDAGEAVSRESPPQESLAAASEEETVPVEAAFAEAPPDETTEEAAPDETTEEVDPAVAVESESPEQHYVEDPVPEAPIPGIPLEALEDEAPEENAEEETAVAVESAVENASPEQHDLEDPAPVAQIPVIPLGASEEEASEENAAEEAALEEPLPIVPDDNTEVEEEPLPSTLEEEESIALFPIELQTEDAGQGEPAGEETAPEESSPEEPAVIVPVELAEPEPDHEEQEETVPIISSQTKDEEAPEEPAKEEEEAVAPVALEENAEVDPATNEEPLPRTLEEEESIALIPIELETDDEGQVEPTAEETAPQESSPEEPAVIVPVEPAEPEPDHEEQEETVPIISSQTKDEEASEEHAKEEEVVAPVALEENAEVDPATNEEPLPRTLEEEESIALFPLELETEEEGQVEPAAEETAPQESAPEDPVVVVPLDPDEESEVEEQVIEESIPIVSPEAPVEETPEEYTEVKAAGLPVSTFPEENAEEDTATKEEPFPTTPEEEEYVVSVHAELDTEEEGQRKETAEETGPATEKPDVIVLLEPTSEKPAPEDPIIIIPLEDLEKDASEHNTEEEVVQSDPLPKEPALAEDTALQENEAGNTGAEVFVTSVTETPSESETIETVLDPGEELPEAATDVHVATEILTEAPIELVTAPAPGVNETEIVLAALEGGEDFKAEVILMEDEPVAKVNRGTLLGAAFFTLMSFIIFGFVWTSLSKKLR